MRQSARQRFQAQDQKRLPEFVSNLNSRPAFKSKSMERKNEPIQVKEELTSEEELDCDFGLNESEDIVTETEKDEASEEQEAAESKRFNNMIQSHMFDQLQRKEHRNKMSLESEMSKDQKFLQKTPEKNQNFLSSLETKVS